MQTAERVSDVDKSDNFVYQRSRLAYLEAAKLVKGKVLEVGSGMGYGMEILSPGCDEYVMLDKYQFDLSRIKDPKKVSFIQTNVPPFTGIADNTFDFVVTFQVIEHIQPDKEFVKEIHRVLKPGGQLIVTTPNKKMSLSRNPWHIREYKVEQLRDLLNASFTAVDTKGVFAGKAAMEYYEKNKISVNKIMRFDIFKMQWWLPRQILQIPYDYMNRRNRKKLLTQNNSLTETLSTSDFFIADANDECLDLFYIATK
ncbi:MAG: class I SAM-dependent methyltransferase [Flavobacteriales bacterium]